MQRLKCYGDIFVFSDVCIRSPQTAHYVTIWKSPDDHVCVWDTEMTFKEKLSLRETKERKLLCLRNHSTYIKTIYGRNMKFDYVLSDMLIIFILYL